MIESVILLIASANRRGLGFRGAGCLHRARIDLEAIAERYGAELSVAEFVNRSVCSECGARWPNIAISLEPGGTPGAKMGQTGNIRSVGALPVLTRCGPRSP